MANIDVTNPGCVNVANQGDGRTVVDQCVEVSPSSNAGSATPAVVSGTGGNTVTATNPGDINVAAESYGRGLPANVNVH
jgi:hypothetical protein